MPALDFTEIPEAHKATGMQDTFEMFARDFLESLGFRIESGPDRGQDGGRDLLAIEKRSGLLGITEVRWLVSCKHKAHSGRAIQDSDEQDIKGRIDSFGAHGFLGFYSTLPSAPLARKLQGLETNHNISVMVFDREKIETVLLENRQRSAIVKRYFPTSFARWESSNMQPANILDEYAPLKCCVCGKDLLETKFGVVVFVQERTASSTSLYRAVYTACKGECDRKTERTYTQQGLRTAWEELGDLMIPSAYLRWTLAIMNRIRDHDDVYTDEAYSAVKRCIILLGQKVFRQQTERQLARMRDLLSLPPGL